jgi:AIPR protein
VTDRMDEGEFLQELRQMVLRRASAMHLVDTLAFVVEVADRLEEDPVFGEFILAESRSAEGRKKPYRVHGYTDRDESDGTISLVIGRWTEGADPGPLLTSDVAQLRSWLEAFASDALAGKVEITPSSPASTLATTLRNMKADISCIRLHIFSNQILSQRFRKEFRSEISGIPTETHIWDLRRLMALYESGREREMVEIDLADFKSSGIPCIKASKTQGLQSYLCVMEGDVLADLFERYGSRLLEGNVRSFLGMKGGVNKGIRATIQDTPSLFFAYNNGIAATAVAVTVDGSLGMTRITRISDLQIVNGGQTTASVLRARKQDNLTLEKVTIPMKLTVVTREQAHDLIPKIAEYANTQNKVAIADFFANHPFHRKMEEISRRLLVPAKAGARVQSKWFYERSRGQFQNERLYLTKAKQLAFDLEYPPEQVINKTELAKYDSIFAEKPHWASLGAQKNFIRFATQFSPKSDKTETEYWNDLSPNFGDAYYQKIVGMAILWKAGEKTVSEGKGEWYLGDYRPQIVAYAWSLILSTIRASGREPDIARVWEKQGIDKALTDCFRRAAKLSQDALLELPAGSTNVGEWAKKESCWDTIAELSLDLGNSLASWTTERGEASKKRTEDRRNGLQDDGISAQKEIVDLAKNGYWIALYEWAQMGKHVPVSERPLLLRATTVLSAVRISSEKDWRKLLEIRARCEREGFRFRKG